MRFTVRATILPLTLLTAVVVAGCGMIGGGGSDLTGGTWQWSASTTTVPASQSVVPDPENYTIQFMEDETFSAKADCNQVNGTYTVADGGGLTIIPGASTMAACPPESMADLYLAGLSATSSYAIADGQLTLTSADGTMTFDQ